MIKNEDFSSSVDLSTSARSLDRFYSDSDNKLICKIHLLFEIGAVVAFKTVLAVFIHVYNPSVYIFSHSTDSKRDIMGDL